MAKKRGTHGTCAVEQMSPIKVDINSSTKMINFKVTYVELLKCQANINAKVSELQKLSFSTKEGINASARIMIQLDNLRIGIE